MPAMEDQYLEGDEAQEHPAHGEMVAHIVEKLRHDILSTGLRRGLDWSRTI